MLRGVMGFGRSGRLHTWKILRLYEDMPLIVEIVDTEEKIKSFLPTLDAMMPSGIVTLERGAGFAIRGRRRAGAFLTGSRGICLLAADGARGNSPSAI